MATRKEKPADLDSDLKSIQIFVYGAAAFALVSVVCGLLLIDPPQKPPVTAGKSQTKQPENNSSTTKTGSSVAPPKKKESDIQVGHGVSPPLTDAASLFTAYDLFQNDAKLFFDLSEEQATVPKCDGLLKTAKTITSDIEEQIKLAERTDTENMEKIAVLKDRLANITDIQIEDRLKTRISRTTEESELLQKDLKKWKAKLHELQRTEERLQKYRKIISI